MSAASHQPATTTINPTGVPPVPPATRQDAGGVEGVHATAADVAVVLALDPHHPARPRGLGLTPYQYLPLFAKVAIERLDCDAALRTGQQLDALLQGYAGTYGLTVDLEVCASAHEICARRFAGFERMVAGVGVQA